MGSAVVVEGQQRRRGWVSRVGDLRLPWFAVVVLSVFVVAALFGPWLVPHEPGVQNISARYSPPGWEHWLGTDSLGRDVFSRLVVASSTTLVVATSAVLAAAFVGTLLGMVGGYFGGVKDSFIARSMDLMLAFPTVFFGLLFAVARGPGVSTVIIAVVTVLWARFGRVVRADVITYSKRDFVDLSRVFGSSDLRILLVHVFPNLVSTLMVLLSISMALVIITESSLSFLGAGIPPTTPSWGAMISDGQGVVNTAWWVSIFPGFAIFGVVLALNSLGDWLRDYMDPKVQGGGKASSNAAVKIAG